MEWQRAIADWLTHLRAAGRPETTIRLRRHQMQHLAAHLRTGPWRTTGEHLVKFAGAQQWARETRRSHRAAVRSFYAWAIATGRMDGPSPADALAPVRAQPPAPRPADDDALAHALTHAGPRERLAIRLAAEAGLRRGEVAVVHERDLTRDLLGWTLAVHGKGGRGRTVPLTDGLAAEVRAACEASGGWAIPSPAGGHLSAGAIGRLVGELLPPGVTMHSLRHRFATRAYLRTGDLLAVQQLLGHATPSTTQRYVLVESARLRSVLLAAA